MVLSTGGILEQNYDAKKYNICCPWYGDRHRSFCTWQQTFLAGIADETDLDCGLDDQLLGQDPHAVAVAAAISQSAVGVAAQRLRGKQILIL